VNRADQVLTEAIRARDRARDGARDGARDVQQQQQQQQQQQRQQQQQHFRFPTGSQLLPLLKQLPRGSFSSKNGASTLAFDTGASVGVGALRLTRVPITNTINSTTKEAAGVGVDHSHSGHGDGATATATSVEVVAMLRDWFDVREPNRLRTAREHVVVWEAMMQQLPLTRRGFEVLEELAFAQT
jgi:hypothetical protein